MQAVLENRSFLKIVPGNCPPAQTWPELFQAVVARRKDATAVEKNHRAWSYEELNLRANQLAHRLRGLGIGPETLVAVCLERSFDQMVTLLAVWKAGGAFLPLDRTYPQERLKFMLTDSKARLLITQREFINHFPHPGIHVCCLDDSGDAPPSPDSSALSELEATAGPGNLAYVIYTSGSTGIPKGVEISHRALLSHNLAISDAFALSRHDRVLQFAPLSFDLAFEEIFPTWLSGATLVLRGDDTTSSIQRFLEFVQRERITLLDLPTAFWHELSEHLQKQSLPDSVRLVAIGGEKASAHAFQTWKRSVPSHVRLINTYGPTETTITATLLEADHSLEDLPIGRPLPHMTARILDEKLRDVSEDAVGELCLAGPGLARGYLNRPELTAEKFITRPDPLGPPLRLYRTGDLVRRRPDGNLEFVGRRDFQVKVRGFRIELMEIETALTQHAAVRQAVVIAREDIPGRKHLVAYYLPRRGCSPTASELMGHLHRSLPAYMVPGTYVPLTRLPLTPGGKIARDKLPAPGLCRPKLRQDFLAPRNELERRLADIWKNVLGLRTVGVKDDFLELGGDSLLALQVSSRIREEFKRELPAGIVFEAPTIETLAVQVQSARNAPPPIRALPPQQLLPVSFVQEQLWFLYELDPESDAYNMPAALRLHGKLDISALEQALNQVIARHDVLRATFHYTDSPSQRVAPELRLGVRLQKMVSRRAAELQRALSEEARKPFELARGPLIRASLIRLDEKDHALLIVMHHSVCDGWSLGILFNELETFYRAYASGTPKPELAALDIQYADYAAWQRAYMVDSVLEREICYWKQKLKDAPSEIPLGAHPPGSSPNAAARLEAYVGRRAVKHLSHFAQMQRVTPFMLLLTALTIVLRQYTRQKDLVIGTVVAGRTRSEFEKLIGCFMNFQALRIQLQGTETSAELLRRVRATVIEAQQYQECPFEKVVSAVNAKRHGIRNPLYNVALLWHNLPTATPGSFRAPGLKVRPIPIHPRTALLDLRFEAEEDNGTWRVACEYDTSVLQHETASRLLQSFLGTIERLAEEPNHRIDDLRETGAIAWLKRALLRRADPRPTAGHPITSG